MFNNNPAKGSSVRVESEVKCSGLGEQFIYSYASPHRVDDCGGTMKCKKAQNMPFGN